MAVAVLDRALFLVASARASVSDQVKSGICPSDTTAKPALTAQR